MNARRWVHASPSFVGFDLGNPAGTGRAACIRAVEEAAAYVVRGHLGIITELTGARVTELTFSGGAAKGALWPQIIADVLGMPVHVPAVTESSALGAALCAGTGRRALRRPHRPEGELRKRAATFEPQPAAVAAYDDGTHMAAHLPADARPVRGRAAQPAVAGGGGLPAPGRATASTRRLEGKVSRAIAKRTPPAPVTLAEFDEIFQAVRNWGRWGDDDELGTLNYITPGTVRAAAALVRSGRRATMAIPMSTVAGPDNPSPVTHHVVQGHDIDIGSSGVTFATDYVGLAFHGDCHTHMDALCHIAYQGQVYNGRPAQQVMTSRGATALDVTT